MSCCVCNRQLLHVAWNMGGGYCVVTCDIWRMMESMHWTSMVRKLCKIVESMGSISRGLDYY